MRMRAMDANGDSTFGQGGANYLVNSPACVAQLVQTRLDLLQGEWFLDVLDGTPYATQILGAHTKLTYDQAIRARILSTPGVTGIAAYSSQVNPTTRALAVQATVNTVFGRSVLIQTSFALLNPASVVRPIPAPLPARAAVGQLDFSDPNQSGFVGGL